MNFATGLTKKAELWLGCKELKLAGSSPCLNEITEYFNGKQTNEHWCAKFVWMVADLTAKDFGIKNLLPKTASTVTMVNSASKKGLRVDTTAKPGSIFFRTRSGGGHVGLVVEVRNGTIKCIEGNNNDSVTWASHSSLSGYKFIHTEEMPKIQGRADEGQISYNLPGFLYEFMAGFEDVTLGIAGATIATVGITTAYALYKKYL